MTNLVVQNFAANVCLATGSSPIMSNNGLEAADLASLSNYLIAMRAYNSLPTPGPIVFDPVGGSATSVRRAAIKQLLAGGFFDCIKGNEGEIKTVSDPSPGPSSGGQQQ